MNTSHWVGDLFALSTALTWAVAVILFRVSTFYLRTSQLKVFQNTVTIVLLFITVFIFEQHWWPTTLTPGEWLRLVLSAVIGVTIGDTAYMAAIRRLGAGFVGVIDCLYSPFIIVLAYLLFQESLTPREWLGASLIFTAILVGAVSRGSLPKEHFALGLFYGVISQLAMAACVILVKDLLQKESVVTLTAYRFLIGHSCLLALYRFRRDNTGLYEGFKYHKSTLLSLAGTTMLFIATLLWFAGFKYTVAGRAAVFNQLSTIFIIIFATLFLKEPLNKSRIFAVILGVIGATIMV